MALYDLYPAAVEDRARELARANGENPDAINWDGDPAVPYGTRHWPVWQEYVSQAEAEMLAEDEAAERAREIATEMECD